ncbi:MAG: tetratricopeptide repeat protein [Bradymonadia bacterium]
MTLPSSSRPVSTRLRAPRGLSRLWITALALLCAVPAAQAQQKKQKVEIKAEEIPDVPRRKAPKDAGQKAPRLQGERFVRGSSKSFDKRAEANWQEAFRLLQKLIEETPDSDPAKPELYFRLSEMYWQRSAAIKLRAFDIEAACLERASSPAVEQQCTAQREQNLQASVQYRDQAIETYKTIVRTYPTFPGLDNVLFALAYNYQQKSQPEAAKKIYASLIRRYPQSPRIPDTLLNLGEILFDAGNVRQALKAYMKVTDNYTDAGVWPYAMYKRGWCHFNQNDFPNALASFIKVIQYANQNRGRNRIALKKEAQRDLVKVYVRMKEANPQKALPFFRKLAPEDYLDLAEALAELYGITGQYERSNMVYRELIRLQPSSYRSVGHQKQVAFNTRSMGQNAKETIIETKRLVILWSKLKNAQDADPEKSKADGVAIELLLRGMSTTYHRQARRTKSDKDYGIAYALYKEYTNAFPSGDQSYVMHFYFGELLFELNRWEEAARTYEKAVEINPQGEYTENAAHGAVLAYKKLLDLANEQPKGDGAKKQTKNEVPKALPLTENHKRFIKACDLYSKFVKESQYLVDIEYDAARIYYDRNQFDQAIPRFKNISEKHSNHRLAVYAANLLLDSYNITKDFDTLNKQVDVFLKIYTPQRDPEFYALLTSLKQQSSFKKCQGIEYKKEYKRAARCFLTYAEQYPKSDFRDKSYYNAALNFEREKEMENAIQARLKLVNNCIGSELVPKALYSIAANLHALAIYSQASKFYEIYAQRYPDKQDARVALQNAAVFRQGLGDYDQAIKDYTTFMKMVGSKKKAAKIYFNMGLIFEKQSQWKKVIDHYNAYLKSYAGGGTPDLALEAYVHVGNAYLKLNNRRAADKQFATAYKTFAKMKVSQKKALTKKGLNAVAEARFQMGEAVFNEFNKVQLKVKPYRNVGRFVKAMGAIIAKKTKLIAEARDIYVEVIQFKSANWAIAALARIGQMFQGLAEDVYNAPAPRVFNEEQVEIFKGQMAEKGSVLESKAVEAYIRTLKKAQELNWFNEWSDLVERQLAKLKPGEYRYPDEVRSAPTFFDDSAISRGFIAELPTEGN